ncbi:MAG: hypothetical protein J07HX5_00288 [halophilic archaeon J07HX5]|jgi:hypothetical protein|nr:MAG: hypothetical protein J07HX5_00288 [halophilic archaeon J07HX5]
MSDRPDAAAEPDPEPDRSDTNAPGTGAYETDEGTVIYDIDEPLAWVQGDNAVELIEMI